MLDWSDNRQRTNNQWLGQLVIVGLGREYSRRYMQLHTNGYFDMIFFQTAWDNTRTPRDYRFLTTNQSRHFFSRYVSC